VPPLFAATTLRVDVGGVPAFDGLTLATTGEHVLVLGAARALFEAAAGLRAPARGSLLVEGSRPIDAVRSRAVAGAPRDPPMPPSWTVREYVTWSGRLSGHRRAAAGALASEALRRMQLEAMGKAKLGQATVPVRRATVIAAALATGAQAILVDDPLAGLPDAVLGPWARIASRALADRRTIFFAGRVPLESPIALAADEAIIVDRSHVAAQGAPAEIAASDRSLSLRLHGDVEGFARAVESRGGRVELATAGGVPPVHARVDLGPLANNDLFRIAGESGAVLIELRPLSSAFA